MHVMFVLLLLASGHGRYDSVSGSQCTASRDRNVID